jgi:endonuclease YncB( thermonuclease family)
MRASFSSTLPSGIDLADPHLSMLAALAATVLSAGGVMACDGLTDGPTGTVQAVLDGNSVKLDSGIVVKLIGTQAPSPAGKRTGSTAEPLAAAAKAALAGLVQGKPVRLELDAEETDRYGRMEAELFLDDAASTWVEAALVGAGMARVEIGPRNRRCLAELLPDEAQARANGLGIWADPYYSVRNAAEPATLDGRVGHYELIEGEIVGTGEARGRDYLDFGQVWKTDLTATVEGKARTLFATAGIDPLTLKGKRVRIRGWLQSRDGPLIDLGAPEQIEVLGPP